MYILYVGTEPNFLAKIQTKEGFLRLMFLNLKNMVHLIYGAPYFFRTFNRLIDNRLKQLKNRFFFCFYSA